MYYETLLKLVNCGQTPNQTKICVTLSFLQFLCKQFDSKVSWLRWLYGNPTNLYPAQIFDRHRFLKKIVRVINGWSSELYVPRPTVIKRSTRLSVCLWVSHQEAGPEGPCLTDSSLPVVAFWRKPDDTSPRCSQEDHVYHQTPLPHLPNSSPSMHSCTHKQTLLKPALWFTFIISSQLASA